MAFTPDEEDIDYALNNLQDLKFNMEESSGVCSIMNTS